MKISSIIETLHNSYLRYKNTFLVVFSLSFFLLLVSSHLAYGDSIVTTVPTQINYVANGKVTSFVSRENNLASALATQGIKLEKNDITEPPLTTALTGQKVYAVLVPAMPVLVDDNGQSWVGRSAYSDTPRILAQLGVTVDPADIVTRDLILDPVADEAAGQKIAIKRAPVYTVNVDGKDIIIHSWSQTVSSVIADGKIALNQNDIVSPDRAEVAPASGQIEVTRVNYADVDETVTIPYDTVNQTSYDLYKGQSALVQDGVNGSKKQSVHIVYHDGAEVSRDVTAETVISSAQAKIVKVGVKPYDAGHWWDTIVAAGNKYGVDPVGMFNVMICESGGDPYAGSYYQGLFQWDGSFYGWAAKAGFPNASINDGTAQIYATALRVSQNGWSAWGCKP